MNLSLLKEPLTVCQLPPDDPIPAWTAGRAAFLSITRTSEELSIVCPSNLVPESVKQVSGWRAFKVEGPLDFALTGILAAIAEPLAKADLTLFALATYNTDYVLVKANQADAAAKALRAAGHTIKRE